MIKEQTSGQGAERSAGGEDHSLRGHTGQRRSSWRKKPLEEEAQSKIHKSDRRATYTSTGALPKPGGTCLVSPGYLKNIQERLMEQDITSRTSNKLKIHWFEQYN